MKLKNLTINFPKFKHVEHLIVQENLWLNFLYNIHLHNSKLLKKHQIFGFIRI